MADPDPRRRTFGPVVLVGLAAGILLAVGGNQAWVTLDSASAQLTILGGGASSGAVPLAGALGYLILATWGVLLVTRGRVRRAVAVLALLSAVGALATCVVGYWTADDSLRDLLTEIGLPQAHIRHTAWYWVSLAAAVLEVLATTAAVRQVPAWPEMSSRYDAPGAAPVKADPDGPGNSLDLWRAMDEGRDPTLPTDGHRDP